MYVTDNSYYFVHNLGIIEMEEMEGKLSYVRTINVPGSDPVILYTLLDTMIVKTLNRSFFGIIDKDGIDFVPYGSSELSDFNNDIIYLPNGDVLFRSFESDQILDKNHEFIPQLRS